MAVKGFKDMGGREKVEGHDLTAMKLSVWKISDLPVVCVATGKSRHLMNIQS